MKNKAITDSWKTIDQLLEAKRLLRDLADLQNGALLERQREEWEKTMDEVYSFLDDEPQTTPKNILTLPDGTTVDLTKPLEVSNDKMKWWSVTHFVGVAALGEFVTQEEMRFSASKFIRNKPEPELKPGDKVWYSYKNDSGLVYWHIGTYSDNGEVIDQDGEIAPNVTIRPAFIDGVPQFPPFND